ncbi:RNA-directed DNA polymerase [Loigolactobacillus coryniformis]|mgnify:CR=1 FL=1|jgi:hypothetical protein|nr:MULTISPECIES: RNA-directed DNA polymerase [Loigolactobacillus]MDC4185602.1 RNA-directed DNA polymerase [Loigolactobacillus coryniformis]PIO82945.1 hypothetical protein BSQ39_04830 [Loigolactobacillus backii]
MSIKSDNINAIFNQFSSTNLPSFVNDFFIHSDVVLRAIDDGKMDEIYKFDDQHQYIINLNYRVLEKPKYIYSNGAESIKYYAFKNDLTLRPMGIANPLWYFAFAHNILLAHDDWLMPFYADGDGYKTVTNHSDSPILGQDLTVFSRMDYDLKKTVNLNILHGFRNEVQTKSNDVYKYNQIRNITDEGEHPFYMKLDVESYYQNIYTHQLDKLADLPPFTGNVTVGMCRPLLTFLDVFNMRISDNQTKGILQGPFSSQFSAELLGLALDSAIQTILNSRPELKEITFKRFVDDFTFYGDNQAALSLALVQIDRIFRSFGLNRKVEKTKIGRGFPAIKGGNFDDPIFNEKKGSIFGEAAVLTMNNVVDLRKKIGTLIDENNISQIRTILTSFKNKVVSKKVKKTHVSVLQSLCLVILKTAIAYPVVSVHCYRLVDAILLMIGRSERQNIVLNTLMNVTQFINENYPETELQIWHYNLLGSYLSSKPRKKVLGELLLMIQSANTLSNDVLLLCPFVKKDFAQNKRIWNVVKSQYCIQAKVSLSDKPIGIENSRWFPILLELYQYARKMQVKKHQKDRHAFKKEIMNFFQDRKTGKISYNKLGVFKLMFKVDD